jgi:hypothetical protein
MRTAITSHESDDLFEDSSTVDQLSDGISMGIEGRRSTLPNALTSAFNRQVFLLSGRRRKKSKTYLISCDPFDITRANCVAKLKSNVIGTQFTTIRIHEKNLRQDHATIIYVSTLKVPLSPSQSHPEPFVLSTHPQETNVLGFKGPRKMTILLPKSDDAQLDPNVNLHELWKQDRRSVVELKNKTPVWNEGK